MTTREQDLSKTDFSKIFSESTWNEDTVKKSKTCGCFYCLSTFPPSEIVKWIDAADDGPRGSGRTALCPKCGVDAVLPENNFYTITPELLKRMREIYF